MIAENQRKWRRVLRALACVAGAACALPAASAPPTDPAPATPATPPTPATPLPGEPPTDDPAAAGSKPPDVTPSIEATRETVRSTTEWLARGVDRWFGDKPFEEGGSVRQGSVRLGVLKRQTEKADVDLRFRARVRLPNLEEKTYLFLGRDERQGNIADRPGVISDIERTGTASTENPSFFAGLGRPLGELFDVRVGFRGIKPYAQARFEKDWQLSPRSFVEFRETLFWTSSDRFGSTTALSWEWDYSQSLALRWVSAATITQDAPDLAWSSVLGGYRSFGDRRLLALEALTTGVQGSGVGPTDYGAQIRWSQPIHSHWLLGEVLVGRFWLRKDPLVERRPVMAVGATLIMEF